MQAFTRRQTLTRLLTGLLWLSSGSLSLAQTKKQTVLFDFTTGFAIFGYDPVAYHIQKKALAGSPNHELSHEDVVWRFLSEANKEAFIERPQFYIPMFGGFCAAQAARNALADGNPEVWEIWSNRLFFFASIANREAWRKNRESMTKAGENNWSYLQKVGQR